MKTSFFLLFVGLLLIFISCHRHEDEDDIKYNQFDDSDYALMINYPYELGQVIVYENQFGERYHLKVLLNEKQKHRYYGGGSFTTLFGGGATAGPYYDIKIIQLELIENQADTSKSCSMCSYEFVNYLFSNKTDSLWNGANMPLWNVYDSGAYEEYFPTNLYVRSRNYSDKAEMNINGHLFERVVMFEYKKDTAYSNSYGALPNNVNRVYYDYDFGIIRFDDIEGKQWKIIYPD